MSIVHTLSNLRSCSLSIESNRAANKKLYKGERFTSYFKGGEPPNVKRVIVKLIQIRIVIKINEKCVNLSYSYYL